MPHTLTFLGEPVLMGSKERYFHHNDAVVLAPASHTEAVRLYLAETATARAKEAAERAREVEEEAKRAKNIEALYARQQQLVPVAAVDAAQVARPGEAVWLGVPPTNATVDGDVSLDRAYGNNKTAHGAAVWLGTCKDDLRLFAVVCPVSGHIGPGFAQSWRRRGTRVYMADTREAGRISHSLGWPIADLHLVDQRSSS